MIRLSSLLAWLAAAAFAVPVAAQTMVSINRPEVNLRAGAGTQHEALWVVRHGYPLQVTGRQGSWLKVRDFENDEAWVYQALTSRTPHHVVKVGTVNIRSAPSTRSRIVGQAGYGEVLRTLEKRPSWVRVRQEDGGVTGWVARHLLWGW
ncbi:SH3 domain-containing protein [Caldimonas sp.]|uniref:SH3 domain-containing protein n=1 Tax=Caldimonas sp. TaxID=2838790 RepID=UPI00391CD846